MRGKAGVARGSSIAERTGVRAAMLRKGRHGKREQSDCGPEHHGTILRPIGLLFLYGEAQGILHSGCHPRAKGRTVAGVGFRGLKASAPSDGFLF
jgi:hypothetical protein